MKTSLLHAFAFDRRVRRLAVFAALLSVAACASPPRYAISDHYDGERFYNETRLPDVSLWKLIKHVLTGRTTPWPDRVANEYAPRLDLLKRNATNAHPSSESAIAVTFVNHATTLIQWRDINILTDPVWSTRVGPFTWAGPKRVRAPGIAFDQLPRIDMVLISHNHYDHLDLPTLRRLEDRDQPLFFVPLGDAFLLESEDFQQVIEMDWWDRAQLTLPVELVFTPAQHNSGRGIFDARKSLWGSFWIRFGERRDPAGVQSVYFAGDTAYSNHFAEIRERLGAPDLAILPIGAYAPRQQMRPYHMDPADAVQAQIDLGAPQAIGIHFGTFQLTNEAFRQPLTDLRLALQAAQRPLKSFAYLPEGRTALLAPAGGTRLASELTNPLP